LVKETNDINQRINEAVDAYFELNADTTWFAAKKIMPDLVKNGIFSKDVKNGMPLRQVLRALDADNQLESIPRVHADRNGNDVYWYFVREGSEYVSDRKPDAPNAKQRRAIERENSDEVYLIGLIDELLNKEGSRKHTFSYLLGDLHQDGETRTELPIDLYYRELKLALEFIEHPASEKEMIAAKQEKLTVSGVPRAEQRIIYFERKKSILEKKEIDFIEIPIAAFDVNESFKLKRVQESDLRVLGNLLSDFIN
jgi:hypothetical protein